MKNKPVQAVGEPDTVTSTASSTTNTNHTAPKDAEYNESLYSRPHFRYYENHQTKSRHAEVEQSLKTLLQGPHIKSIYKSCHYQKPKKDKVGIVITRSNIPEFNV